MLLILHVNIQVLSCALHASIHMLEATPSPCCYGINSPLHAGEPHLATAWHGARHNTPCAQSMQQVLQQEMQQLTQQVPHAVALAYLPYLT